jgi:hypothetical protein
MLSSLPDVDNTSTASTSEVLELNNGGRGDSRTGDGIRNALTLFTCCNYMQAKHEKQQTIRDICNKYVKWTNVKFLTIVTDFPEHSIQDGVSVYVVPNLTVISFPDLPVISQATQL